MKGNFYFDKTGHTINKFASIAFRKKSDNRFSQILKILFTANRFPYPPYRGDKLKIYHLAKRLSKKHDLHLITFLQDEDDLKYVPELKEIFNEIYLIPLTKRQSYWNSLIGFFKKLPLQVQYFHSLKMAEKIEEIKKNNNYDAVHVQHLRMAQYWNLHKDIPRILDLPDAYSLYWKRRINNKKGLLKSFAKTEQRKVFEYEDILNEYDLSLVCSGEDQAYLQSEKGIKNVQLLPNGVDLSTFSAKHHDYSLQDTILFTGNMNYAPNVDAVIYFCQEIFPLIQKKIKNVRFIIAGQKPLRKVKKLADEAIEITGFVKDLSLYYEKATIVVAPLRFGAGTQNKVLEAMAMGVPVVSRNIGFNGLNIESGNGVVLSTETQDFANQCIRLLENERLRKEIGKKGKEVIQKQFDWDVIADQLERYLLGIQKK